MDRAHRRLPDRGLGRFPPEATATNLIYSFPTGESNSGCTRLSRLPLYSLRLSWATFSPDPKIFLWKSPDRVEKILRMRASEDYNQLPAQSSWTSSAGS
jgi:hypothetical protein